MASILKVDQIGKTSGSTQDTMGGLALWATVDAELLTAFDSFNVASIQDDATGKYGVTTTSPMGNANYYACGVCCYQSTSSDFDRYLGNNYTKGDIDGSKQQLKQSMAVMVLYRYFCCTN